MLSVAPRSFDEEIERLFISLNYQELRLPEGYTGSAQEIIDKLNMEIKEILAEIRQMKQSVQKLRGNIGSDVKGICSNGAGKKGGKGKEGGCHRQKAFFSAMCPGAR